MALTNFNIRRGNTWTPKVTIAAPFSLTDFTALAGIYDKPSRTTGAEVVPLTATVTPTGSGGDISLLLTAANSDQLDPGTYYLAVQIYRNSDGYVHEIDYCSVIVSEDTIEAVV